MSTTTAALPDPSAVPLLLDVTAVARLLSVSVRSVWRLRDAGELPAAVCVGKLIRWRRDALLRWLDESTERRQLASDSSPREQPKGANPDA